MLEKKPIKPFIKDLTFESLLKWLKGRDLPAYRAKQIKKWLYRKDISSFDEMSDLPKDLRSLLDKGFSLWSLKKEKEEAAEDKTVKFLFSTYDGENVESVLIPDKDRLTLCISCQIGCKMGCLFCLTGQQGFRRNLTRAEILDQVLLVRKSLKDKKITNIVFMGMGEPLDNYEESLGAWEILTSDEGLGMSTRRVTISTVGLIPPLKRLLKERKEVSLAISLNATDEETRNWLMPVTKEHPLKEVMSLFKEYPLPPRRRLTLEYVVLKGINHSSEDVLRLKKLTKGLKVKVNLIPFNPFPGAIFERPSDEEILEFQSKLRQMGISAFIRKTKGQEIFAACGLLRWQLARNELI